MRFSHVLACAALGGAARICCADVPSNSELQEVVVTASLRPVDVQQVPASVTVLDAATLQAAGEQHFEDVIALVPNLNWAGDTSRPRYFQVRGVGELEQYQGAPNPSVGFLIDDIDFSGLGTAATLFDVDRIEVLRGPQGTRYGANALGGLIYVQSAAPEPQFDGHVELGAGDYGGRTYGAVLTGPIPDLDSGYRVGVQRYTSNGFYQNAYLHRDDTDANDELTARARWRYEPSPDLRADLALLYVRIDNGYDAFAIDNTRTTQSDKPGEDSQHSTGASLHVEYRGLGPTLTLIGTIADSRILYSFDSDWGNPILWAPYIYDYTDAQTRERRTNSLEARLGSDSHGALDWLIGLYTLELTEDFQDTAPGQYVDPFDPTQDSTSLSQTTSHYSSRNSAVFGELDGVLAQRWRWSVGLRGEYRSASYHDVTSELDTEPQTHDFAPVDHLWGGHASLEFSLTPTQRVYLLAARGYKAGGFNLGPGLPPDQILYAPEWDLNIELGYKAELLDRRLRVDVDVFRMQRHSLQLRTGEQLVPDNPSTFVLYTANAPSGRNDGLEASATWRLTSAFDFAGSLGLLNTEYHGLTLNGMLLPDRALPHAPDWQAALAGTWHGPGGTFLRLDVSGNGSFYFDVPALDPYKSSPYWLFNAKAGIERERWSANVWIRNIGDKRYAVRGFYFGDVPPDFTPQQYVQLGSPRQFGVLATYSFR
jgi:outer membrane receptor protein involved in Fe transport